MFVLVSSLFFVWFRAAE